MVDITLKLTGNVKAIRTVDMTPTWEGVLPLLLAGIENGTVQGRQVAKEELTRMAQLADAYVRSTKEGGA